MAIRRRQPVAAPAKSQESATQRAARKAAKRGRALQRAAFVNRFGRIDEHGLNDSMTRLLAAQDQLAPRSRGRGVSPALRAFAVSDAQRWVPIGPSVVRLGQAEGRPRVAGRIRDIAVDATGTRAYAASAKGGVWYTADAGSTWDPVGGWADRPRTIGGAANAQACGCLLVTFNAGPATDVVLVGTGETVPALTPEGSNGQGGIGILSAVGPAGAAVGAQPWEPGTGIALLEGAGVFRLDRHPAATPGATAPPANVDRVAAATSLGLFIGTRVHVAAVPAALPNPAVPEHDEFQWVAAPGYATLINTALGGPPPSLPNATDVMWIAGGANGRMFVAIDSMGLAFSDDAGATFNWVTNLAPSPPPPPLVLPVQGFSSLSRSPGGAVYVLGEAPIGNTPTLWQISAPAVTPPVALAINGLPNNATLWGTQRDYDQAIAVTQAGGSDRVVVGGSVVQPFANSDWCASLWCYDVTPAPALNPAVGVARVGSPPGGDGANQAALIGNNVHGDVHVLRWTGPSAARQLWIGCDGGVFVSTQGGRINSFLARVTGLAALEAGYVANHPTSSHFVAAGFQDNGTQVRAGDTVWEETFEGDGGGVVFHPIQSQYVIAEWTQATWNAQPTTGFVDPIQRRAGGPGNLVNDRENGLANFYSSASAIQRTPTTGRIALGTNRVWITDDVGSGVANTWQCLPAATGFATDPRGGGGDTSPNAGVPPSGLNAVIALRWTSATDLLALYAIGVVRYTQQPNGRWTVLELVPGVPVIPSAPNPGSTTFTDIAHVPVGGSNDFYLVCAGEIVAAPGAPPTPPFETCWFFDAATSTFNATGLRAALPPTPPAANGPCDPAFSVVVDPVNPTTVYVGTVTGVWQGVRTPGVAAHIWAPFVNGLPQATVQDLSIWVDPAAAPGSPRLLRAAIQSRGVWEVDLAALAEPARTFVRVHARDDRRRFPTPMANPRRRPAAPLEPVFASPDIVIRPQWPRAAVPNWRLKAGSMVNTSAPPYQLWTFQTAFRWQYPSVVADGRWTDQLGDLVELHRSLPANGLTAGRAITQAVWNQVLGNTRIDANGALSHIAPDQLAVFRAPWQSSAAPTASSTEVDLIELVQPPSVVGDVWQVYREPCTVDVLVHHRDTRPRPVNDAWVILLWRSDPNAATLTGANLATLPAFALALAQGNAAVAPAGWNLVPAVGPALHRLPVAIDARLPRAVSIDVDLTTVAPFDRVLFVAVVGSGADILSIAPNGAPVTVSDLVRNWPYAAMRLVTVINRP